MTALCLTHPVSISWAHYNCGPTLASNPCTPINQGPGYSLSLDQGIREACKQGLVTYVNGLRRTTSWQRITKTRFFLELIDAFTTKYIM